MKLDLRDSRGAALVELAVTMPLFLLLIMGAFELGQIAYYSIEAENAARAAATYGSANVGNSISASVLQAAKNDAPDLSNLTVTSSNTCVCETLSFLTGTPSFNPSSPASCSSSIITNCTAESSTSTQSVVNYVNVSTQATVDLLFHLPALPQTYTIQGHSALRILQN